MNTTDSIKNILETSLSTKKEFLEDNANIGQVAKAADAIIECYRQGGKVIVFGNGGSAADSQHMAAELLVRFEKERKSFPCIALTTNASTLTATANDYDFGRTFSRQIEALANSSDIVIAISTSGNSSNVIEAVKAAHDKKAMVIGLTGNNGGELKKESDIPIVVNADNTARIQEVHITIIHAICKVVEDSLAV